MLTHPSAQMPGGVFDFRSDCVDLREVSFSSRLFKIRVYRIPDGLSSIEYSRFQALQFGNTFPGVGARHFILVRPLGFKQRFDFLPVGGRRDLGGHFQIG
jgi:hypothetical protein